jgi:lipooligosaccharide transport system ATP-binding protein
MDGGRIAAAGSPRELIDNHATREVLELRFPDVEGEGPPDGRIDATIADLGDRIEHLAERVILYTDDGEAAADAIHARGLRPDSVLVRRSTLEDVFLRLTGRSLIE